jgi:hypothetical protein
MRVVEYDKVCYWTEQREEHVAVKNLRSGEVGHTFGCTYEGETVQVRLQNGELDSWRRDECVEVKEEGGAFAQQ